MKDVKEYSDKWTDWDSNRECLKFDKVGKPSSSTIIATNNHQYLVSAEVKVSRNGPERRSGKRIIAGTPFR